MPGLLAISSSTETGVGTSDSSNGLYVFAWALALGVFAFVLLVEQTCNKLMSYPGPARQSRVLINCTKQQTALLCSQGLFLLLWNPVNALNLFSVEAAVLEHPRCPATSLLNRCTPQEQ